MITNLLFWILIMWDITICLWYWRVILGTLQYWVAITSFLSNFFGCPYAILTFFPLRQQAWHPTLCSSSLGKKKTKSFSCIPCCKYLIETWPSLPMICCSRWFTKKHEVYCACQISLCTSSCSPWNNWTFAGSLFPAWFCS